MPSGLFHINLLDQSISSRRDVWLFILLLPYFIRISPVNLNSIYIDQTLRPAASDLGIHCLPMSLLWNMLGINGFY